MHSFFPLLLLKLWLYEWQELDDLLGSSQRNWIWREIRTVEV